MRDTQFRWQVSTLPTIGRIIAESAYTYVQLPIVIPMLHVSRKARHAGAMRARRRSWRYLSAP